jgi:hypothetical protein
MMQRNEFGLPSSPITHQIVVFLSSCDGVEFHHALLGGHLWRESAGAALLPPSVKLLKLHGDMPQARKHARTKERIRERRNQGRKLRGDMPRARPRFGLFACFGHYAACSATPRTEVFLCFVPQAQRTEAFAGFAQVRCGWCGCHEPGLGLHTGQTAQVSPTWSR